MTRTTKTEIAPTSATHASFSPGDVVVYPGHGVGTITCIETQHVADQKFEVFVISFAHDRMTLRVPLQKVSASGLRSVSTQSVMQLALAKLKESAGPRRAMWNRRALEYTTKINSGDVVSLAEVVRDLHCTGDRKQSHSERVLYEQALSRLTHEWAVVEQTQVETVTAKLELLLKAA